MSIVVAPNHISGLVTIARSNGPLTTLLGDSRRVASKRPSQLGGVEVARRTKAVVLSRNGGLGRDLYVPRWHHRVQVECFGATGVDAATVARTVASVLQPVDRRPGRILANGCLFEEIWLSVSAIELVDDEGEDEWPYTVEQYEMWVREVTYS